MEIRELEISVEDSAARYQKLYEMLLNGIPSSVLLVDKGLRIVSANRNFLDKSRKSLTSTIGHKLEDVFPAIILDHIDIVGRIRQVFERNEPIKGERMTYRAPGVSMRIYYYSILPFSWKGMVETAMLLMEDVTEQVRLSEEVHRVERHLASVVGSASDIVLSMDTKGKILTWNPAAEKISGYDFDKVKGQFFFQYLSEDHQKEAKRNLAGINFINTSRMAEWDFVTKEGGRVPVSWVFSRMKNDLSEDVGIVAVGRDLMERRKFEMQLLRSQKLAALGVMAGGIAHEIRNPLAVCSSAAQFLANDDITSEFRKECAAKIHAGIQKASAIIENLLRFAKPSATNDVIQLDLNGIVGETLKLVANQAKIQKIELISELKERPVFVNGVSGLLEQVFMNLFLNAIKAMPDGGRLRVTLDRIDTESVIYISDTGYGISKADMDNIFDPFYTTSPVGEGTGLGLSICYSIVKQHLGTIEVDSVEGQGTTFIIRLPIL